MLSIHSVFDILSKVDTYPAEDFVDRLNFGVTVYLLGFFVLITGSKQHFGNPIQCMAPPESPESWVNYYHDYCYIQDKLRIFDMNVYKSVVYETRQRAGTDYTPIGRFPKEDSSKYWSPRVMYYQIGIDLETAIIEARKIRTLIGEDRRSALIKLAKFIRDVLKSKHRRPFLGSSVASLCYVITKWLEVVNGFGQFYMLSCFVGQGDYLWGFHLMVTVLKGSDDPNTGAFPRIVLCDVARFALANLHQQHMQCVLMLNFINEKIYTFLWFWIVFVSIASTFSAMKQTIALLLPVYRGHIADNFLPTQDVLSSCAAAQYGIRPSSANSRALVDFFVHEVLRCDGVLLFSFINGNVGGLVTHDIAQQLWKITVQPINYAPCFIIGDGCGSTLDEYLDKKKSSSALFWPKFTKMPNTTKEIGLLSSGLEAGELQSASFSNNKHYTTAKPIARIRSLSVGNLGAQLPTAPLESLPLISDASTQAFDDSTCPIQSLYDWPTIDGRRRIQAGPGVALVENRCHDS
ncbi:unnamed protein product [Angiostrongylus costaricensis]|uniref:Innexin n=1 Tax=Angiostrongylus costaricensis TaxID=334426 RepID=A0A0R3PVL7_ANGCS|nr:unnamed protein product [Angiostrongylus costaricensis]